MARFGNFPCSFLCLQGNPTLRQVRQRLRPSPRTPARTKISSVSEEIVWVVISCFSREVSAPGIPVSWETETARVETWFECGGYGAVRPSIRYWRDHSAGSSHSRVTPMPCGRRASMAALTRSARSGLGTDRLIPLSRASPGASFPPMRHRITLADLGKSPIQNYKLQGPQSTKLAISKPTTILRSDSRSRAYKLFTANLVTVTRQPSPAKSGTNRDAATEGDRAVPATAKPLPRNRRHDCQDKTSTHS